MSTQPIDFESSRARCVAPPGAADAPFKLARLGAGQRSEIAHVLAAGRLAHDQQHGIDASIGATAAKSVRTS